MATTLAVDFTALKARQQSTWACGDYSAIGSAILIIAELLVEALDVRAGWRVLDVASGSGNASLAAARRGCRVTSTDYVPSLLERGRLRAEAEGLRMQFEEADAENLPFEDDSYDAVLSTVGVMFAPNHERAAGEMFRVCKSGGSIGLANWTPAGFVGQMFKVIGKYAPPPAGIRPPSAWGTEERLRELFPQVKSIVAVKRDYKFRAPSADAWLEHFRTWYGPMLRTYTGLDAAKQAGLTEDILELCGRLNVAGDGTMVVPSEYLEVVIRK